MGHLKSIDLTVGIYNSEATITRHKNGDVTIRSPFVKWENNNGYLAFENIKLTGKPAKIASENIFIDQPVMSYGEFIEDIFYTINS